MRTREKIAITVAPHLLAQVEQLRKRSGESRSAVFERAVAAYLANASRASEARRYVDAYRNKPETAADERAALVRAFEALAAEPWDAAR
jgi:metal-responsive CopG/Arc/MetJ family transcriptional regulator